MKRAILLAGLLLALAVGLLALLTPAVEHANLAPANASVAVDEGPQLGSGYPEITHWPQPVADEGAQLGSAKPEVTRWPEPAMQAGTRRQVSPGE
jgi:hypothetical protein